LTRWGRHQDLLVPAHVVPLFPALG
jgi:hypothetical protein